MLTADHPDIQQYRKDPDAFVTDLFRKIKVVYSPLYNDHVDDIVVALERLKIGLHEGFSTEQFLHKAKQAAALTEQQYRSSTAKFVRDYYWRKQYGKPVVVNQVQAPKPYTGPTPKRP